MLKLKELERFCAKAREHGLGDEAEVKFCAGNDGVPANAKIQLNAAANIVAGSYLENPSEEIQLEAPELVLNQ